MIYLIILIFYPLNLILRILNLGEWSGTAGQPAPLHSPRLTLRNG